MFVDNDSFQVSAANKVDFHAVCDQLKNVSVENNPWKPFFVNNTPKRDTDYSDNAEFNVYNLFETPKDVFEPPIRDASFSENDLHLPSADPTKINKVPHEENPAELQEKFEDNIARLKETLDNIQEGYPVDQICPILELFCSVSPHQVPCICDILDVSSMNEMAIAVILNSLSSLDLTISLVTAASIVCHIVYNRVKQLTSSASRIFISSILQFAEKYPKAVVDELIVPCLNDKVVDTPQVDLLQKIIKSSLPDDEVLYCFRKALNIEEPGENTFSTLQCLVERKVYCDLILCKVLLEKLLLWSKSHSSSMKFSKLLLSVTSVYGSQMTEEQKLILGIIARNVTTFLKKGIESLVKKLC